MKRKTFIRSRVASSENYEQSLRIHRVYLKQMHQLNITVIEDITIYSKVPYTIVCGKKVMLSKKEISKHPGIKIIWE